MCSSIKIINLTRKVKCFIEEQYEGGIILRLTNHEKLRESKFSELEKSKKEEELFT